MIYRRGNVWWYRFSVKGKPYRGSCKTSDEKQALEFHDREKARAWRSRVMGDQPDRTVNEAIDLFLKERGHKRSYRDDERYGQWWKDRFEEEKIVLLSDLTADVVREIRDAELGRKHCRGVVSPATVNRKLAFLRSVVRAAAHEWQWIANPPKLKLLPGEKQRERYLTPNEVERLVRVLPHPYNHMALFAVSTGLRQGNVLKLKWFQVDLANRCIRFPDRVMKNGRPFAVALSETATNVIRTFIGKHEEYVFAKADGSMVTQVPSGVWAKALHDAGLSDLRWHDLRHTWASLMRQSGMGLDDLQELGGWESPLMVRRYAHLSVDHLREKASRLDGVLSWSTNPAQAHRGELSAVAATP